VTFDWDAARIAQPRRKCTRSRKQEVSWYDRETGLRALRFLRVSADS
jgi:hypothetical protein